MKGIELVADDERREVIDYIQRKIASTLTEIYDRCGENRVESFYETASSMGIRMRHAMIYWEALSLYEDEPLNMAFQWLAKIIVGEIFHVKVPGAKYVLGIYPIFHAVSFSCIDLYITATIEVQLKEIYADMDSTGRSADEIMEKLRVPDVIRSIYKKAISVHELSNERISFEVLADDIFSQFGCNASDAEL